MKKAIQTLVTGLLILLTGITAQAQFSAGIYASAGLSTVDLNGAGEFLGGLPERTATPRVGLSAEYALGDQFSLWSGIAYHQKGFAVAETFDLNLIGLDVPVGARAITRLHYLEVPLLARFKTGTGPVSWYAKAGPTVGYAVKGVLDPKATFLIDFDLPNVDINLDSRLYNRWEVSATAATGVEIAAGPGQLQLELGYTHGLSNLFRDPLIDVRLKNSAWQVGVGYSLPL